MEEGGAGDGAADGGNGLGAFALAADIAAMKLLEKSQEQDAGGGGGGGGGDGAPAPAAATRDPDPAAAKRKKMRAACRPKRKADRPPKKMPAVGAKVLRFDERGTWYAGYEVTALHTGDRTMDLKDVWGSEV